MKYKTRTGIELEVIDEGIEGRPNIRQIEIRVWYYLKNSVTLFFPHYPHEVINTNKTPEIVLLAYDSPEVFITHDIFENFD